MKKNVIGIVVLLATAIASGYALLTILKKAGLEDLFDFDLNEDNEDTDNYSF
jgi:hypothetical protein